MTGEGRPRFVLHVIALGEKGTPFVFVKKIR